MVHDARRKDFDTQWKIKGSAAGMAHAVPAKKNCFGLRTIAIYAIG